MELLKGIRGERLSQALTLGWRDLELAFGSPGRSQQEAMMSAGVPRAGRPAMGRPAESREETGSENCGRHPGRERRARARTHSRIARAAAPHSPQGTKRTAGAQA